MEVPRADLEALMRAHRFQYCCIGDAGHGGRDGRHDQAAWVELEQRLLTPDSRALIGQLVELLRPVKRITTPRVNSYALKHTLEEHPAVDAGYVSNGQVIAAALLLGFSYRLAGPNAVFGMSRPDIERLRATASPPPQADAAQHNHAVPRPTRPRHDDITDDEVRTLPATGGTPRRPDPPAATPRSAARPRSHPPPAAQPIGHVWPVSTRQRCALDDAADPRGRKDVFDEREISRRTGWSVDNVKDRLERKVLRGERTTPQERARTGGEWRVRISDLDAYLATLARQQAARQRTRQRQQRQRGLGREREL